MRGSIETRLERLERNTRGRESECQSAWLDTASMSPEDRAFAESLEGTDVQDIPTPDLERLADLWLQYGKNPEAHEASIAQLE